MLRCYRAHLLTLSSLCSERSWWRRQMETLSWSLAICAGIHRSPVNSPHKGLWRGALMFSLICAWINGWVNNHEAGDLICHGAHYYATVMWYHNNEAHDMSIKYRLICHNNMLRTSANSLLYKAYMFAKYIITCPIHSWIWTQLHKILSASTYVDIPSNINLLMTQM